MITQPGQKQPIQQMPEHMGCAFGTAQLVSDACQKWLVGRGLVKTQQDIKDGMFRKKKVNRKGAKVAEEAQSQDDEAF